MHFIWKHIYQTLFRSWVNIFLLCVPVGFALNAYGPPIANLIVNSLAAIPLLGLGDVALENIGSKVGTKFKSIIYISTRYLPTSIQKIPTVYTEVNQAYNNSNLMLLVSSISYLQRNKIIQLQQALVGCLLANLLFLPAFSILYAAYRRRSTIHNFSSTRISVILLMLSVSICTIPTVFSAQTSLSDVPVASISRAASVVLILAYGAYIIFQFWSHQDLFETWTPINRQLPKSERDGFTTVVPMRHLASDCVLEAGLRRLGESTRGVPKLAKGKASSKQFELGGWAALFAGSTVLLYFTVDNMVASIDAIAKPGDFGMMIGFILVPLLNCDLAAVEQTERSMDLVLTFTVGKSIQSALFNTPLLVIIGWGMGKEEINLSFDFLQIVMLFLTVMHLSRLATASSFTWSVPTFYLGTQVYIQIC